MKDLTVNWPARGSIEFKNYFVKYRPNLPHVIHNLSVSINAHEKVIFLHNNSHLKSSTRLVLLEEQAQASQLSSYLYFEFLGLLMVQLRLMELTSHKSDLMI